MQACSVVSQRRFYDPRRAIAIRAWMDGDLRLALLQWAEPDHKPRLASDRERPDDSGLSFQAA